MSLEPLLNASLEIRLHTLAAIAAFLIGLIQFARKKGDRTHRRFGWAWVILMAAAALSSLFVNTNCDFGPFSAIHLLTLLTIILLPLGVMAARRHRIRAHAGIMIFLFTGALLIAGAFTFIPGRTMHDVVFGTTSSHERCWPPQTAALPDPIMQNPLIGHTT